MIKKKVTKKVVVKPDEPKKNSSPEIIETEDKVVVSDAIKNGYRVAEVKSPFGERINKLYVLKKGA